MRAVGIGSREAYLFWRLDARDWTPEEDDGAFGASGVVRTKTDLVANLSD
jgi:hypothetical protein